MTSGRPDRALALALVAAFALRTGFALVYWRGQPLTHDEQEYLALAVNIAAGRGFTRDLPGAFEGPSVEHFARPPLYPCFVAGILRLAGQPLDRLPSSVPPVVQVAQAAVGTSGVWLVALLAGRAAGERGRRAAAWMAALYPPLVWLPAFALSETVYSPLVLASAWCLGAVLDGRAPAVRVPGGRGVAAALAAGLLGGLAALARSSALAFAGLAAVALATRRRLVPALALVLGAAAVIAPWTARNAAVFGRPILVAADGGVNVWIGNHPLAIGEGDLAANPALKAAHVAFRDRLAHLTPEEREPYYYRAALAWIREHPGAWVRLTVWKLFYTWVPVGPSYRTRSPLYFWSTVVSYGLVLALAIAGLPALRAAASPPRALGVLLASAVLVNLVTFPQDRYRVPVIDPVLIVAGAAGIARRQAGRS
jgi:hypothetical protein